MENLEIYEKGRCVPKEAQKSFSNGSFSGTDINPMWRIKKLTELFGAAGVGWYYEVLSERSEEHDGQTMAIVDINLYIKVDGEWSKPIYGTGGNMLVKKTKSGTKVSDEGYKMALTDAIGIAAKALGIGADIWFANDKTKYTENSVTESANIEPIKCEECFRPIKGYTAKNGKYISATDAAGAAMRDTGRFLCVECWKAERAKRGEE